MKSSESHSTVQSQSFQTIDRLRQLQKKVIEHLPRALRADCSERVQKSAEYRIAQARIIDMEPIASRETSHYTKTATKIVIIIIGSLTFSAGTQVLTSRLGPLALPAAMAGGALASYLVDDRATKVMTNMRITHGAKQELAAIHSQGKSPNNELDVLFYESQKNLIQQIEGKHLEKQFTVDGILAVLLSGAEFSTALWIVVQMGLPGGLVIEAIAASLPVAIIWLGATVQSDRFELPEHYTHLIKQYQEHKNQLHFSEEEDSRLDYLVKYVAEGDLNGRLKNMAMAQADYQMQVINNRKKQLEIERDQEREQRFFQCRADEAKLPAQFPAPEIETLGSPQEISDRQKKVEQKRQAWVEQQTCKLKQTLAEDLQIITHRYNTQIEQCDAEFRLAKEQYDEAYQNWKADYGELGSDLEDIL